MKVKRGQPHELRITGVAFGGRGLSRIDGLTVFVDQAVPQDRVLARITKKRKNYAEARIVEILEPSADRIHPPCPYSGTCGGCFWQFLKYEKQLAYKQQHVAESIDHIGGIREVRVLPTLPSPSPFGYRNKMEFTCSDRRWLMPAEMGTASIDTHFALGLHVPGTFHKVLDTRACLLQPDLGNRILGTVRAFIRDSGVPVYGLRSHEGFWRFLVLRHSVAFDRWMVNVVTSTEDRRAVDPLAELLMDTYPAVASVVNNVTARKAGVAVGEYERHLGGEASIKDRIDPYVFDISANSFFQTNTAGAHQLYRTVKTYAELTGSETVIDLYSGTGTIPIFLSDSAREIVGLEIVEGAVTDAIRNCRRNGIDNCRFVTGDIRETVSTLSEKADVMVIDPPRAGMHKDVVRQVLEMAPGRMVYVSCNPATLARDLGLMKDHYRVVEVQPVDMFPHTFHIEAVAKLEKIG